MIGRGFKRGTPGTDPEEGRGFDAFELRLGDMMRGERATMGKSLLDVQRELKIKAAYIAAIENSDPTAFDTPGFIAGYVRSYARYLHMDPDWAFDTFCRESGFATAHGMSQAASSVKQVREERAQRKPGTDPFESPQTPFLPAGEPIFSRIEPGAVGSVLVLCALIGGLGYGGWTVLQQVQQVRFAPVEQTPTVVSQVDPLAGGEGKAPQTEESAGVEMASASGPGFSAPSIEDLDRLYRPEALDTPVMTSRDAPISMLDPDTIGALAPHSAQYRRMRLADTRSGQAIQNGVDNDAISSAVALALGEDVTVPGSGVQVTEDPEPKVQLIAVRPAWVRVRGPDGTVLYETTMQEGDTYEVPQTEEPATLRIGESGAVYFAVNGKHYGPVGPDGAVSSDVALSAQSLQDSYNVADISADSDLARVVDVAEADIQ